MQVRLIRRDDRIVATDDLKQAGQRMETYLDYRSVVTYTILISSILYFQRKITGSALISAK